MSALNAIISISYIKNNSKVFLRLADYINNNGRIGVIYPAANIISPAQFRNWSLRHHGDQVGDCWPLLVPLKVHIIHTTKERI